MMTETQILLALRDCYDPELRLNLVELGMVASVDLTSDPDAPGAGIPGVPQRFRVTVTLLHGTADEDAAAIRTALVHNRLAGLEQLSHIAVLTAGEPVWTAARIAPAARLKLGLDAPQFPILNNRRG